MDERKVQVDLETVSDAVTIDPDKLSEGISLPSMTGDADAPIPEENVDELTGAEQGPLYENAEQPPVNEPQPQQQQQPQEEQEEEKYKPEKISIAGEVLDYVDRTFFGNEITPDLIQAYEKELQSLNPMEMKAVTDWLDGEAALPMELKPKLSNFIKAIDIEDENTNLKYYGAPLKFVVDVVQGYTYGKVRGAATLFNVGVDCLNFIDDHLLDDSLMPNKDSAYASFRKFTDFVEESADAMIPDGALASIAGAIGTNTVGMRVASGLGSIITSGSRALTGTSAAATLRMAIGKKKADAVWYIAKSAFSSSMAFAPESGNLFNALEQVPGLKDTFVAYLAVDPNDTEIEGRMKNLIASIVGDIAMIPISKAFSGMRNLLRRKKGDQLNAVLDGADDATVKAEADAPTVKAEADVPPVKTTPDAPSTDAVKKQHPGYNKRYEMWVDDDGAMQGRSTAVEPNLDIKGPNAASYIDDMTVVQGEMDDIAKDLQQGLDAAKKHVDETASAQPKAKAGADAPDLNSAREVDVDAAYQRALKLRNETLDTTFNSPNDVVNLNTIDEHILKEDGVAQLLTLGNDTNANVLGRDPSLFTSKANAETLLEAQNALKDMVGDIDHLQGLAEMSYGMAAGIVKAKALLVSHTRALVSVLKKLDRPDLTADVKASIVENELRNVMLNTAHATSIFDALSTNTGRALQAHKINIGSLVSEGLNGDVYKNFAAKLKQMSAAEVVTFARSMACHSTPRGSKEWLKAFSRSKWQKGMSMVSEYWYNSILSGAKTHSRNILGNFTKQVLLMPADNLMRGVLYKDREAWNDGIRGYWAMWHSVRESFEIMCHSLKMGTNILGVDNGIIPPARRAWQAAMWGKADNSVIGRFLNGMGYAVNWTSRMLTSADEFFEQLAYRSKIRTSLYMQAEDLFAKGAAPEGMKKMDFILKHINDNFDNYFTDATNALTGQTVKGGAANLSTLLGAKAMETAKEAVFAQDVVKGSFTDIMMKAANSNPAVRFVMPFIKIPTNILSEGMRRTPGLNVLSPTWWRNVRAGGEAAQKAWSQLAVGGLITTTAGMLAYSGAITGAAPKNKALREALYAQGWRPYSIKVGDSYWSYEGIEPISNMLGLVADFAQLFKEYDGEEGMDSSVSKGIWDAAGAVLGAMTNNITNKSYLRGVADTIKVVFSGDREASVDYLSKSLTAIIPNISQSVRQTIDPSIREARTFLERLQNKVPIWNESLPMQYNWITGEASHYMGERASGVSPIVFSSKAKDSTLEALGQVQHMLTSPGKAIMGHRLTGRQYSDYCRLHGTVKLGGKTMLQAIERVVDASKDKERYDLAEAVNKVVLEYRNAAKKELQKLYPELKVSARRKNKQSGGNLNLMDVRARPSVNSGQDAANALRNFR